MTTFHKPVLIDDVIELLAPAPGGIYVDATLGGGGCAAAICDKIGSEGVLVGIDRDREAIEYASQRLKNCRCTLKIVKGNFRELGRILEDVGIREVDGVVFDFGLSSHQLDTDRGFTLSRDEELDMRMSREEDLPTAADIVNTYSESDLERVLREYGDERYARRIARAIVRRRQQTPITRTTELADIVRSAVPGGRGAGRIHPATRAFMALRIEIHSELEAVEKGLLAAVEALKPGGRVCALSYHSGEDRIVKAVFRRLSGDCHCPPRIPECRCGARRILQPVTRKAVRPGAAEVAENPRSRSARLRCAEKL